jgi:hypothetical protein
MNGVGKWLTLEGIILGAAKASVAIATRFLVLPSLAAVSSPIQIFRSCGSIFK